MSLTPGTVIFANQQRSAWLFTNASGAALTPPSNPSPLGYSAEDFGMIMLPGNRMVVGFMDNGTYGNDGKGKVALFDLNDLSAPLAVTDGAYDFYVPSCLAWNGSHLYAVSWTITFGPTARHYSLRKIDPADLSVLQTWDLEAFTGTGSLGNTVNLAVSPDGATLYMGGYNNGHWADDEIGRYDLVGESVLGSWTTPLNTIGSGGDEGNAFLMLADASLLVGNEESGVGSRISRFDASGTIIQTYIDNPAGSTGYHFGITPGRTTSTFWCAGALSGVEHKFEIRLSDGATVGGFDFTDEDFPGHFAVVPGVLLPQSPCALHTH